MTTDKLGKFGPHPALRDVITRDFNRMQRESAETPVTVTPGQLTILQQRTFPSVLAPPPGRQAKGSLSGCLVQLRDVPHPGGDALMLALVTADDDTGAWQLLSFNARSVPAGSADAFEPLLLVAPPIGLLCGIFVNTREMARLRVTAPDGDVFEDESNHSLLVLVPLPGDRAGWTDERAPLLQLLNAQGRDVVPPARLVMPRGADGLDA